MIYDGTLITLFELKFDYFFLNRKLDNDDEKEESPENASEKTSKVYSDRKLTDEGPLPWCQSDDLVFVRTHHMFSRILNFKFVIQGPSWQTGFFELAITDRNMQARYFMKTALKS